MTKQQQIDALQKQLDAANEQIAAIDNALKEQYVNVATNIVSEIKSWFEKQSEHAYLTYKDINYKDVYKYLDNYRNVIEATSPKYTPSILCQLSMVLSEARRQLAEQRIVIARQEKTIKSLKFELKHLGERICRTKDALNAIYGVRCSGKLPKTLDMQYVQEVINEYLKQQFKEDNNEDTRTL